MKSKNLSYAYYIEYYDGIDLSGEKEKRDSVPTATKLKAKNNELCSFSFSPSENIKFSPAVLDSSSDRESVHTILDSARGFKLATCYPGLLIGTGDSHQFGGKGESALGFSFDYVTGIPYIPGSSVKGLIRSAFQGSRAEYGKSLLEKMGYTGSINKLITNIFGPNRTFREEDDGSRDIFFDAVITGAVQNGQETSSEEICVLDMDSITPHRQSAMKDLAAPVPISFIKIRPGIVFLFSFLTFDFKDKEGNVLFSAKDKTDLFKRVLLDFGIGSKTNVGYGVLEEISQAPHNYKK